MIKESNLDPGIFFLGDKRYQLEKRKHLLYREYLNCDSVNKLYKGGNYEKEITFIFFT